MTLSVWDCFILQILTYQTETGKQTIFAALHFSDRKRKVFLGGVGGWDAGVSALFVLETAEVTVWLDPSASLFVSMSFRPESAEDFQPVVSSPVLDATPPKHTHKHTLRHEAIQLATIQNNHPSTAFDCVDCFL